MRYFSNKLRCGPYRGRRFRSLMILDDHSRESVAIEADFSLTGERVARVLERLAQTRGFPNIITVDNGPEFAGKALDAWPANGGSGTTSSAPANW